ncbi:hypothetical protein FHW67_000920 [Herbaspirillum sp. Sphag1AN]|nr:hypothetical protein [Herbaspirillum sp. Sphag1AN]MBB3245060.1 hypothetical protein [Herbaspirillum sp. Sphag64]
MSFKHRGKITGKAMAYEIPLPAGGVQIETFMPWMLVRREVKRAVITPLDPTQDLAGKVKRTRHLDEYSDVSRILRAVGLSHYWQRLLHDGAVKSVTEIAAAEGLDLGRASRIARLAQLAPELIESILAGHEHLYGSQLLRRKISFSWHAQCQLLPACRG